MLLSSIFSFRIFLQKLLNFQSIIGSIYCINSISTSMNTIGWPHIIACVISSFEDSVLCNRSINKFVLYLYFKNFSYYPRGSKTKTCKNSFSRKKSMIAILFVKFKLHGIPDCKTSIITFSPYSKSCMI